MCFSLELTTFVELVLKNKVKLVIDMGKEYENCKEKDGKRERVGRFILVLLSLLRNQFLDYNSKYFYYINLF